MWNGRDLQTTEKVNHQSCHAVPLKLRCLASHLPKTCNVRSSRSHGLPVATPKIWMLHIHHGFWLSIGHCKNTEIDFSMGPFLAIFDDETSQTTEVSETSCDQQKKKTPGLWKDFRRSAMWSEPGPRAGCARPSEHGGGHWEVARKRGNTWKNITKIMLKMDGTAFFLGCDFVGYVLNILELWNKMK